ncbi:hypothetical protein DUNSADRAFT_11727 [Dunaliella salina]|uniref:Encoded protein n=1 Tax=Dunaliella salina TaxID=3046 RepID=A0ABQ7GCQ4_DUNSA|nr:hypothetical protein DUNSADRAFT_11727 [Dunaliella salina]|eukprot:KAF5832395.1 hypothetical protein DUNSADRAFT_11727 [Dunaliella salina]
MALLASKLCSLAKPVPRTASRRVQRVQCAAWTKATNKSEVQANGGRKVSYEVTQCSPLSCGREQILDVCTHAQARARTKRKEG